MKRSTPVALITPIAPAIGALLLAACGQATADSRAGGAAGTPAVGDADEVAGMSVEEHDRRWPDIATLCADAETGDPDPGDGGDEAETGGGGEPENPRHAENNGYEQSMEVPPEERCRGEAHSTRIAAAMTDEDGVFGDVEQTKALLERLGYGPGGTVVEKAGTGVATWSVTVAGAGPCISGHTGVPHDNRVHGMYADGGCHLPKGGH